MYSHYMKCILYYLFYLFNVFFTRYSKEYTRNTLNLNKISMANQEKMANLKCKNKFEFENFSERESVF